MIALLVMACAVAEEEPPPPCPGWEAPARMGSLESAAMAETSGIVAGRRTPAGSPAVWWAHNDSGDTARVFAIDDAGRKLAEVPLLGATARDWEDIAVGPGPEAGTSYLYIGDIGDNVSKRPHVSIWRVPEPEIQGVSAVPLPAEGAEELQFRYPDGAHDAETLLVDPLSGDLFVVTKAEDGRSTVFRAPAPHAPGEPRTFEIAGRLSAGRGDLPGSERVVGGDISADGVWIALRTYSGAFLWIRAGRSVGDTLSDRPCGAVPVAVERQGEALGFAADGSLVTVGEGRYADIWRSTRTR